MNEISDPKQWVQPLFLIYDPLNDKMVPLTQERLDRLLKVEQQYGRLMSSIKNSHEEFVASIR